MTLDIRLSVEFFDHPKTIKLERRLGLEAIKSLIVLWLWCRTNKPKGIMSGMDVEDIEIAAKWFGEEGAFVNECLTLRWLDVNGDTYSLHDWDDHNAWAVDSEERSNMSRFSRMSKTHPHIYEKMKKEGRTGITSEEYKEVTRVKVVKKELLTNVNEPLTPTPTPTPIPAPKATIHIVGQEPRQRETIPYSQIVSLLNEKSGKAFKPGTQSTKSHIRARWAEGFRLEDFAAVIEHKVDEWKTDAKMCEFLRPVTLFGTKFESYLQAATSSKNGTNSNLYGRFGKWKEQPTQSHQ